jgi:DNA-binding NarL/FixJ family response regulator
MAPNLPRVLIVDDHSVVRMGLRAMIEQSGRYTVAGPAHLPRPCGSRRASSRRS